MKYPLAITIALGSATPALSDQVFTEDVIVQSGLLCVGGDCVDGEPGLANRDGLKIKGQNIGLRFQDSSTGTGDTKTDWELIANDASAFGRESFFIRNDSLNTAPVQVKSGAPTNTLVVSTFGNLGLGTEFPESNLHIVNNISAELRLERSSSDSVYGMIVTDVGYALFDRGSGTVPFFVEEGAATSAVRIAGVTGNIGLGTATPDAPLELSRDDTFNFFRITATGAAINESVDITFTGGPLGTGQLRYNIVDGDNQEMSLDADGNMVLDGTLTTAGPTCAGGCDRVFDADYPLPSIADHAAQMYAAGHLPSLGPTAPGAPVNVSEKLGQMLNALEYAHIYIAQQDQKIEQQSDEIADLRRAQADLMARLEAVELR